MRKHGAVKNTKNKGDGMRKVLQGIINKYLDYDIVGEYLEWQDGKFVKKYIRKYKWRKRG